VDQDEDRWYGVFQGYRPRGDGVEEVFAGLPDAPEYAARIRSVCQVTLYERWAQDAYFVVHTPQPEPDEQLIGFGQELLRGLRLIAVFATLSGKRELHEYLSGVSRVVVAPPGKCNRNHEDHQFVHETVGDILRGFQDYSHRIVQLREGFYSVACDYWLAWYLQWPYFHKWVPQDVFRPYFDLWSRGCEVAFRGEVLCIVRRAEQGALDQSRD
jgi:hypothetical protein